MDDNDVTPAGAEMAATLKGWFVSRPVWQQLAADDFVKGVNVDKTRLKFYADQAVLESERKVKRDDPGRQLTFPDIAMGVNAAGLDVRLIQMDAIEGVNRLAPRSPLKFGDARMSIIFGCNGSGKTGYTRILKHACLPNCLVPLHDNVYAPSNKEQKCTISIQENGVDREVTWSKGTAPDTALETCAIYDSQVADVFINKENEIEFEPSILRALRTLIGWSDEVSKEINFRLGQDQSKKPNLPIAHAETISGKWWNQIGARLTRGDIDKACSWNEADEKRYQTLLGERAKLADPSAELKRLGNQATALRGFKEQVEGTLAELDIDSRQRFLDLRKSANETRRIADEAAKVLADITLLDGIGSSTWRALWKAAREYSDEVAYPDAEFPNIGDDALCILCQQSLTAPAMNRFTKFEEFIASVAEQEAKKAEDAVDLEEEGLPKPFQTNGIKATLSPILDVTPAVEINIQALCQLVEALLKDAKETDDEAKLLADQRPAVLDDIHSARLGVLQQIRRLRELDKPEQRASVNNEIAELESLKWITEQKDAIIEEVDWLKRRNILLEADKLTNTGPLSTKRGELSTTLVTKDYIDRFNAEMVGLSAKGVPLELVQTKTAKGRTFFAVRLKDIKVTGSTPLEVLSEGEFRIASLAAFLANLTGREGSTPFVFDDPITSLDEHFEDAVVTRLLSLSQTRQVIVFTHRLSLMLGIETMAKEQNIDYQVSSVSRESWGTGEPRKIAFGKLGYPACWNGLEGEVKRAAKFLTDQGSETYEREAKWICSELRISVERLVEQVLLSGVVERYRLNVKTLNVIDHLSKIRLADCQLIDRMMTKYSYDLHSQPSRKPHDPPPPDEILADLAELKKWYEQFSKRPVPAE